MAHHHQWSSLINRHRLSSVLITSVIISDHKFSSIIISDHHSSPIISLVSISRHHSPSVTISHHQPSSVVSWRTIVWEQCDNLSPAFLFASVHLGSEWGWTRFGLGTWKFYKIAKSILCLASIEQEGKREEGAHLNINKALDKKYEVCLHACAVLHLTRWHKPPSPRRCWHQD